MSGSHSAAYRPHNPRWFNRLLGFTYGSYIRLFLGVRAVHRDVFDTLRPPYIILGNHVTIIDPFMVGSFVPEPVYWIASDSTLRTTLLRTLLKLVGTIPKSKFIPDIDTINAIVHTVRKRKGVIGIFPEGAASFDGTTMQIAPATGKLLKLLKVPVVRVIIRGGYASMPRWSWKRRRGPIEIDFAYALSPEDLKRMSGDEIQERLAGILAHNEAEWQQHSQNAYLNRTPAEHLESVLFQCPSCSNPATMQSQGRRIFCSDCGYGFRIDRKSRLHPDAGPQQSRMPTTIPDWSTWQLGAFRSWLNSAVEAAGAVESSGAAQSIQPTSAQPLFTEHKALIKRGRKLSPLRSYARGSLRIYPDRIEFAAASAPPLQFAMLEIEGEGVFKRNLLEFYHRSVLYQVHFHSRSASAWKWQLAIQQLRAILRPTDPPIHQPQRATSVSAAPAPGVARQSDR